MDLGIFCALGRRDGTYSVGDILRDNAELVGMADQADFGSAWFTEHHFSNYGLCPSPLMMAMYCAAQTRSIKMIPGILVLPLYSPVRLISEIGMLDSISGGRLELGVGSGYQPFEFQRFGIAMDDTGDHGAEMINLIQSAYSKRFFSYEGRSARFADTQFSTIPERPMPPMWVAGHSPRTIAMAAQAKLGLIQNARFGNADAVLAKRLDTEADYVRMGGDLADFRYGLLRYACVTESKAEAEHYADNARYLSRVAYALRNGKQQFDGAFLREDPAPNDPTFEEVLGGQMIGGVETCIERGIEEIRKVGPDAISLYFSIGDFCGKKARRSLELFIERVIPGIEKELGPLKDIKGSVKSVRPEPALQGSH